MILCIAAISGCTSSDNQAQNTPTNTYTNPTPAQNNTTNTQTETQTTPQTATQPEAVSAGNYIGNANSHIFHQPWCHYVDQMKESNKVSFSSRGAAINAGYRPCKVCNP